MESVFFFETRSCRSEGLVFVPEHRSSTRLTLRPHGERPVACRSDGPRVAAFAIIVLSSGLIYEKSSSLQLQTAREQTRCISSQTARAQEGYEHAGYFPIDTVRNTYVVGNLE